MRLALFVDPYRQLVMLFRPDAEPELIAGESLIEIEDILPGFRLTARELFSCLYIG